MTEPVPEPQPAPTEPVVPSEPSESTPTEPTPGETTPEEEEAAEEEEPGVATPDGEPPPEETQPQGMTQKEAEARFKKSETAWKSYQSRIENIWEEEALQLTPVVISPSAPPGFLHNADAGRVPQEIQDALMLFFGMPVEVEYEYDPNKPACDRCKGKGQIRTGSEVPSFRTLPCEGCQGRGFVMPGQAAANGPAGEAPVLAMVAAAPEPPEPKDADDWGHPRILADGMENPNYGRMPQYVDPRFP